MFIQEKFAGKTQEVLDALIQAGSNGVLNIDLNEITFRYSASIHRFRLAGYRIETFAVEDNPSLFRFVLVEGEGPKAPKPGVIKCKGLTVRALIAQLQQFDLSAPVFGRVIVREVPAPAPVVIQEEVIEEGYTPFA